MTKFKSSKKQLVGFKDRFIALLTKIAKDVDWEWFEEYIEEYMVNTCKGVYLNKVKILISDHPDEPDDFIFIQVFDAPNNKTLMTLPVYKKEDSELYQTLFDCMAEAYNQKLNDTLKRMDEILTELGV